MILNPEHSKGIIFYVYIELFVGCSLDKGKDIGVVLTLMDYIITYESFLITWKIKIQTDIMMSNTEAEYVALQHSTRDVLTFVIMIRQLFFVFDL